MSTHQQSAAKLGFRQKFGLLTPYVKKRIFAQIQAVSLIVVYLVLFQTIILRIPISDAAIISVGIAVVVIGLAFFMEGLFLGLMPLGEVIGIKLPQKAKLPVILIFSFILGIGATFAEPAIGVLKAAGMTVRPWSAPLLFTVLNRYSGVLVYAVGVGVGFAVVFGMLRFIYGWSLKKFIYILIPILSVLTVWAALNPNMRHLTGLAWDCGGVTTGPVTVPLVLALGIGICRIMSKGGDSSGGFGVVTLASLFPILAVFLLGLFLLPGMPEPMSEQQFFKLENREKVLNVFGNNEELTKYAVKTASYETQIALFGGNRDSLTTFVASQLNTGDAVAAFDVGEVVTRNSIAAVQAIIPLSAFLLLVFIIFIREKLGRRDEIFLGILLAVIGMSLFNIGIETGLSKLGNGVGKNIPSSFTKIELTEQQKVLTGFDTSIVHTAIRSDGTKERFFYAKEAGQYVPILYNETSLDTVTQKYNYTPSKGPLFGGEGSMAGFLVVLIFAFIMGYGATLAEPALNALGATVEEITVGTFRKTLLIQAVAGGVGLGMLFGVAKIIWNIPLAYMLVPPYLLLIFVSKISTDEFVNIAWDSAGVTTGPITVPLVLAIGLGIGGQMNVVEGFGILSMASVCPILVVLSVGLFVSRNRKAVQQADNA
jgi:hypothetical protein